MTKIKKTRLKLKAKPRPEKKEFKVNSANEKLRPTFLSRKSEKIVRKEK